MEFLNKFNNEYYGSTFNDDKITTKVDKRYKKKRKVTKRVRKGLHAKAGVDRKELYNATNARARDIFTTALRIGSYHSDIANESPEDALIEALDRQREGYIGFNDEDQE